MLEPLPLLVQLCKTILLDEFDAEPEPATTALYQQVRLDPGAI
jgi:hypothetical protein